MQMTDKELRDLWDVTPEPLVRRVEADGTITNCSLRSGFDGVLYRYPEDVEFKDQNGTRWEIGRLRGMRVRRRCS